MTDYSVLSFFAGGCNYLFVWSTEILVSVTHNFVNLSHCGMNLDRVVGCLPFVKVNGTRPLGLYSAKFPGAEKVALCL